MTKYRFFGPLNKCILVCAFFCVNTFANETSERKSSSEQEAAIINAVLRTATIYVKDWDASIKFYTDYLGYKVLVEQPITKEKSLRSIGAGPGVSARIAYLKPNNSHIQRPFIGNYLGLIGFHGGNVESPRFDRPNNSPEAVLGEVVLAHQVVGVEAIYKKMMEDDIRIVEELSLSGAAKSRSFSAIDPNGIRVEVYEYIDGEEPLENP